jgi:hypothetical protein
MKSQAERIIEKFGGASVVAKMLGVDPSRPYRWMYPKASGGSGGIIPAKYHEALMRHAHERGVDLTPHDFFAPVGAAAPKQEARK